MNELVVSVQHRSSLRQVITNLDAWRTRVAKQYADAIVAVADPPVLTGALKSSVYVATRDGDNRSDALVRARQRRAKVQFGKPRRVTKPGVAFVAWAVVYAPYVERKKPWVRRALNEARRRVKIDGITARVK